MAPSDGGSARSLNRSRRFIEVQPGQDEQRPVHNASSFAEQPEATGPQSGARNSPGGRSRRTPHSVIERARRSRMNEEFAILQEKLPYPMNGAYKLEILQVSAVLCVPWCADRQATIEYITYLEETVASLKARLEAETAGDVRLPPLRSLLRSTDDGPSGHDAPDAHEHSQ